MQAVIPPMRRQGGGAIVNVSSMTSRMVLPGAGAYSATKAALTMLSQVARRELAQDGIVVSLVYPSVTATEFHASLRAGARVGGDAGPVQPQSPERVAQAIVGVIRSGEEEESCWRSRLGSPQHPHQEDQTMPHDAEHVRTSGARQAAERAAPVGAVEVSILAARDARIVEVEATVAAQHAELCAAHAEIRRMKTELAQRADGQHVALPANTTSTPTKYGSGWFGRPKPDPKPSQR